jgi:septal ring factor EnvC (AmiA/AmiB activator)
MDQHADFEPKLQELLAKQREGPWPDILQKLKRKRAETDFFIRKIECARDHRDDLACELTAIEYDVEQASEALERAKDSKADPADILRMEAEESQLKEKRHQSNCKYDNAYVAVERLEDLVEGLVCDQRVL